MKDFYTEIKYKSFSKKPNIYCPACGYEGKGKLTAKGSILIEVVLWLFIIPGLLYTLWRDCNRYYICPKCHNDKLARR